jgi:hypothetical protein
MSLKFNPKVHRYWLDGKPVQGVTTLLKGGLNNDALMYWSARTVAEYVADNSEDVEQLRAMGREPMVAALKSVPWEKRNEAAVRGTDVHALAELLVHGDEVEVPSHLAGFVNGYVDFLDRFDVAAVLTERAVGSRTHWYAGKFDLIADINGTRWMLDNKTSKGVYGSTALQLAAYANGEFYVEDDDPETELPLPEGIERYGVLHVTEFSTELRPVDMSGDSFADFLAVAAVAKSRKRIDAYLLDPITEPEELESL